MTDADHAPNDGHEGGLQRVLGVPALFSAAYGNVGSSIYYALGLVAGFALGLTPLAFVVAGVIFVLTALTYAEGTTTWPEAGGSSSFARHAWGEVASFVTAWAQLLNFIITLAISAYFVPHYLGVFWEPLGHAPGDVVGGIVVIVLLAVLNVVGIQETAALTVALALADLGTQVLLALLGVVLLLDPGVLIGNVDLGVAPTWTDLLLGISLSMIAYTGIETISNLAEETRDPVRSIPRAIGWVVVAVIGLYAVLPLVALSALPVERDANGDHVTKLGLSTDEGGFAGDPFIGIVRAFDLPAQWMRDGLEAYVGLLAAVILFIAANAGIIGVSRVSYSMAQYRHVPDVLRRVHPRFLTPYVSIIVFSLVGCVLLLPSAIPATGISGDQQGAVLGNLYAFGAMLTFSIAHAAIIRVRLAGTQIAWRAPGNVAVRGRVVPLFAFVGLAGTGSAWLVQVATHPLERVLGLAWMLVGPVLYVAYRRRHGLPLTTTVRAAARVSAPSADIAYRSIVVPVVGGALDHAALNVALRVAAKRGALVGVVGVIEVPRTLPLHAYIPEVEDALNAELDVARAVGDDVGVDVVTRIVRARAADAAIVDEVVRREAELVVLGVRPARHPGRSLVGSVNERILRRSPVRVLVVREHDDLEAVS